MIPGPQPIVTRPGLVPWCASCGFDVEQNKPHDLLRNCLPLLDRQMADVRTRFERVVAVARGAMTKEAANAT